MTIASAEQVIQMLGLESLLVEGGFFRRTFLADETLDCWPQRYRSRKALSSAIYYLLGPTDFSALHRLASDEIYHFYLGDPVELVQLLPNGGSQLVTLGQAIDNGQQVQTVVRRGVWQGSRLKPGGRWALLGTTMSPAYADEDFELGERAKLLGDYPDRSEIIRELTR
jgi:hypothetical protein